MSIQLYIRTETDFDVGTISCRAGTQGGGVEPGDQSERELCRVEFSRQVAETLGEDRGSLGLG